MATQAALVVYLNAVFNMPHDDGRILDGLISALHLNETSRISIGDVIAARKTAAKEMTEATKMKPTNLAAATIQQQFEPNGSVTWSSRTRNFIRTYRASSGLNKFPTRSEVKGPAIFEFIDNFF